ncbi:MAG: hypothetical protein SA378_09015 [Sedimentibacter sp.]|uniref:hypothetical protein n=1 Tax=Sedimentibacter sp. TaxID=1960295 RepID=UPI0029827EDC|nr:hypothetical protein [Sedimentibacter sp.]MDW5300263.1 hypothetical protein [Sedimentibacter sp.]
MKEIIDQIINIDNLADESKSRNEETLLKKKQEYEDILASYRNEKLENAKKYSQALYEETEAFIKNNDTVQKEKIQQISAEIEKSYLNSREALISKTLDKLFVSGR